MSFQALGAPSGSTAITVDLSRVIKPSQSTPKEIKQAKESLDQFMQPESGLAQEIKSGLVKIERICKTISSQGANDTPPPVPQSKAIVEKTKIAKDQLRYFSQKTEQAIQYHRKQQQEGGNKFCAALPEALRVAGQCKAYQLENDLIELIDKRSQIYYADVLERYRSYDSAVEMEGRGCTRPGFTERLWRAELEHMLPRLERADAVFNELLKYVSSPP